MDLAEELLDPAEGLRCAEGLELEEVLLIYGDWQETHLEVSGTVTCYRPTDDHDDSLQGKKTVEYSQ